MNNLTAAALAMALTTGASGYATAATAPAPAQEVFTFRGDCSDCYDGSGSVSATLTLQNYTPGDAIDASEFVSFSYGGSDLFPAYSITDLGDLGDIEGSLGSSPGFYNVNLFGRVSGGETFDYDYFNTDDMGGWNTGVVQSADIGVNGVWNETTTSAAPEPAAWALTALGVGFAGAALRRRRAVALA